MIVFISSCFVDEKELSKENHLIKQQKLGLLKEKKKIIKPSEKFKFGMCTKERRRKMIAY